MSISALLSLLATRASDRIACIRCWSPFSLLSASSKTTGMASEQMVWRRPASVVAPTTTRLRAPSSGATKRSRIWLLPEPAPAVSQRWGLTK